MCSTVKTKTVEKCHASEVTNNNNFYEELTWKKWFYQQDNEDFYQFGRVLVNWNFSFCFK